MPVPDGAGRMRMVTGAPLCSPTPQHSTAERIVCSRIKKSRCVAVTYQITPRAGKAVCGKKATLRGQMTPANHQRKPYGSADNHLRASDLRRVRVTISG